jgi:NADH-quinone oxidoreductase subunit L
MEHGVAPATGVSALLWLVVVLPAISAAILLLTGRFADKWGHLLGCLTPLASFVLGAAMFFQMMGRDPEQRAVEQHLFEWIPLPGYHVEAGLQLDQLSRSASCC